MTHPGVSVERIGPPNLRRALTYLSRSPFENVFLSYLAIEAPPLLRRDLYVVSNGEETAGVAFFGRQIVVAAEEESLPALADLARPFDAHAIVGPRQTLVRFWDIVRPNFKQPRIVRDRQPVMRVDAASLVTIDSAVRVRSAREDEWREILTNSAAMIAGELETDPRADPEFESGVRRMIRMRLWWVGELDGRLCFFCNIGAWSPQTAQLQGIWTPPGLRRRGLAAAALSGICRELLGVFPTLSLYVNDFNAPAIALYRRLGFTQAGELQTILL